MWVCVWVCVCGCVCVCVCVWVCVCCGTRGSISKKRVPERLQEVVVGYGVKPEQL